MSLLSKKTKELIDQLQIPAEEQREMLNMLDQNGVNEPLLSRVLDALKLQVEIYNKNVPSELAEIEKEFAQAIADFDKGMQVLTKENLGVSKTNEAEEIESIRKSIAGS